MRTEIAIISALALVLSIPLAFGQVDSSNGTSATGTSVTGTSVTGTSATEPFVFDTIQTFPYTKPNNLTDEGVGFYEVRNPDGTFTLTTHYPYFETETGNFVPYRLNQDDSMIQVEVNGGKFVFDKTNGAVTIFDEDEVIVNSDSYVVKSALEGTDVWNNLTTNNEPVSVTVYEQGELLKIIFQKENDLGVFKTVYTIYAGELKTDLYFLNNGLPNSKISFTETLELPNNTITLNDQVIDLNQFVGMSFDRETLEQNEDLVLEAKEIMYNAGLGFEYLWQVNIHEDNKISLDYANSDQVWEIGQEVWLDPTWSVTGTINGSNADFNISTLNNAIVNSGDISGTALTSSQITSLQNALNSGTTTWSQPFSSSVWLSQSAMQAETGGSQILCSSNLTSSAMTTSTQSCMQMAVGKGAVGSIQINNAQSTTMSSVPVTMDIKDFATNQKVALNYALNSGPYHSNVNGSQVHHGTVGTNEVTKVSINNGYYEFYKGSSVVRSGTVTNSSNYVAYFGTWGTVSPTPYTVDFSFTGSFGTSTPVLNVTYTLTPSIPTDVSATQNTTSNYNTVDLTWNDGTGGSNPTSYTVYRDGSSIGTVNQTTLNSDHSDDFSTDNWSDTNFTGVSGGVLTGNLYRGTTNHGSVLSLGSAVDNSQWVMRFQLDINTKATAENNSVALYLSDSGLVGINSNKDGLGLGLSQYWNAFRLLAPDNTYSFYNTANLANIAPNTGTYYVEIKRTSSTTADMNIYSDSSYSTLLDSVVGHTISSGIQNLDTVVVQGMNDNVTSPSGTWNISIDNLEIWDGVTSVSSLDTNFTDSNAPHSSNLSYTVSGTNTVGTSSQSTAGLIETFYVPNQVVNVTNQGASSPLVLDWDIPTVPSVTNTITYPDTLGSSADGTNVGTTTTGVSGIIGDAWNLADTGDVDFNIPMTSDHTIGMWLEFPIPSTTWTDHTFITSTTNGHYLYADGNNVVGYYSSGGNFSSSGYDLDNVSSGWHYLVLTSDHTNTETKIYIDGTQVGNTINSVKSNGVAMDSISNINQGIGKIDEVVIYNKALTASEISALYNSGNGDSTPDTSGLLAHYDFEDTGNTLTNISSQTITTPSPSLSGYQIERDDGSGFNIIEANHNTNQYSDSTAAGSVVYRISGLNAVGTGTASANHNALAGTPPDPPTNLTSSIQDVDTNPLNVVLNWTSPSNVGTGTLSGFEIYRNGSLVTTTGLVTTYTDTVTAGTHSYYLKAVSNHGSSIASNTSNVTTPTVPSSPLNASSVIADVDTAPYDVTVTWETPSSTGGSDLTQYNVYRKQGSGAYSLLTTTTGLTISDTLPSSPSTNFTYKIHSVNNVGESTGFTDTTITTFDVPQAPTLSVTTGTTVLSWNTPTSDGTVTNYKIYRDGSLLTTVGAVNTHSDFTPIVFGNSYDYKIVAVSSLGDGVDSNTITTTPETEITGMVVQGITGTGAVIDWDEPAYYQGQITSYNVYYSTPATSANPTTSAGTTTNTYSNFAPTLEYDTSYTFGVTITSPLGNSGFSNLVNATTNVDNSIVAYDPNTGTMDWFDIDSVSEQTVNVIEFQRMTQDDVVNGTTVVFDTLQVGYPSWWDDMTCDVDYKFAQKTEQYVEGEDMTAVVNSADANQQVIGFQFHDIDNEVIEVTCAPQVSQHDDEVSAKYVMTQQSFGTLQADGTYSAGMPNIPLVTQIQAFQTGEYGTDGEFGALDVVGLFVILISMVGFNRLNPIVGVLLSASLVFGLSFFGIISLPTVLVGVVALVIFLAWGITRNR